MQGVVRSPRRACATVPQAEPAPAPVSQGAMPSGPEALLYVGLPALGTLCLAQWILNARLNET